MLKSQKSQLTCSYCSRIFKDPILLQCDDSICSGHLKESDVVKQNTIKCNKCNGEFGVRDNEFKSNEDLNKLIESLSYLSGEEMSLKKELEASIRKFFEFYDELNQNKSKLESDVFNYFQEMRFQVDEHRERIKEKIDEIALEMIDKIKKHEESFSKSLKEHFSSFDETRSLESELNQIEATYRDPNLLIQTIHEMQQKQETALNDIQSELNEMSVVKDYLEATNYFKPNLSSFTRSRRRDFNIWFN
jgi:chromosome segregation ATPase